MMRYNTQPRYSGRRRSLMGFSLVELMVALAIGLVLVAGLATLFANSSRTGAEIDKSMRQIENGRYAAELLSENVGIAGYYGELVRDGLTVATPAVASLCSTAIASLGWDNAALTIPAAVTGLTATQAAALSCLSDYKTGTAALVLRHVDTSTVVAGASTNGSAYLQTSRCSTDLTATKFVFSTASTDFTLRDINCATVNSVQRYVVRIYYIASCNECGGIDTTPTLKRAELVGNQMVVSPLVEGLEEVTFDYGFDTNNDGGPEIYRSGLSGVAAAADNDWNNVVGIRMHLLSRTIETSAGFVDRKTYDMGLAGTRGSFNDAYKRRAYTVTVRINNVAGPRETP